MKDGRILARLTSKKHLAGSYEGTRGLLIQQSQAREQSPPVITWISAWSHIQTELRPPGLVNTTDLFARVVCADIKLRCCSLHRKPSSAFRSDEGSSGFRQDHTHNKLYCFAQLTSTLGGQPWNEPPSAAESNTKDTISYPFRGKTLIGLC